MKNTNLPLDEMYEQMGRDAHNSGKPRIPAADTEIMSEVKASQGNGAAIMHLWLAGWDKENLALL